MKKQMKCILLALWFGLLLPSLLMKILSDKSNTSQLQLPQETTVPELVPLSISVLHEDGIRHQMELDAYVVGVVLGEMPADFEPEALKAQAVVARTYALRRCTVADKHAGSVCTDPACCQAWNSDQMFLNQGGTQQQLEKIRNAVLQTHSQVLTYEGQLIEATFFACSGGSTEDAAAVWGSDVPYLQAVDSPGEEKASAYLQTIQLSRSELTGRLGVDSLPENFIGAVTYTRGGGVEQMVLGDTTYSGTKLRQLLGLPSTAFYMTAIGDTVTITTRGHGHRVGMSQYGADAMAAAGSDYQQILNHYYKNTELTIYQP